MDGKCALLLITAYGRAGLSRLAEDDRLHTFSQIGMSTTNDIGDRGEDLAASVLQEAGYRILERNYRSGHKEVDLICYDPREDGEFVFVEVKTRTGTGFGPPTASVTADKQQALTKVAQAYLYEQDCEGAPARFDVIGILLADDEPQVKHYENAFFPG